jgi:VIT1/CCC1 family predicted Fe2+/Mn2+ transporter
MLDKKEQKKLRSLQKEKISSFNLYSKLQKKTKDEKNKDTFSQIAESEKKVYDIFKKYTKTDVKAANFRISFYLLFTTLFGFTFSLKLFHRIFSKIEHSQLKKLNNKSDIAQILEHEEKREKLLLESINEKRLQYVSSIVLGLNDSLVEITAALAGFTFAIQVSHTIALMGLISGSAASLSIAASEYLSKREETTRFEAFKSSLYTGISYALVVVFLILPYFLISNPFVNLGVLFSIVVFIIFIFNFYISIAKEQSFFKRFFEMALVSITIAAISFGVGFIVRKYLGLQI